MDGYRVQLDVYNGPLDLLLYLIRREEVDIYDIPIAHITEQYCRHVELIEQLDPNLAGEFLVMAATLLELKSRMLLPSPPPAQEGAEPALADPRAELVRQLLEYKAFKDAADRLREAGDAAAMRYPRAPVRPEFEEPALDLENVQVWHLLDAFGKLMASIGRLRASHEVIYDDTPIALHAEDILERLGRHRSLTFRQVFEGRTKRSEMVGLFLAMLELIRQNRIGVHQEDVFGEIYLFLRTEQDDTDKSRGDETMIAFSTDVELAQMDPELQTQREGASSAQAALAGRAEPLADLEADRQDALSELISQADLQAAAQAKEGWDEDEEQEWDEEDEEDEEEEEEDEEEEWEEEDEDDDLEEDEYEVEDDDLEDDEDEVEDDDLEDDEDEEDWDEQEDGEEDEEEEEL